jgi:Flp pilus assembly protein TadD
LAILRDLEMTFLVVDDQFNMRRMIVNFLRHYQYSNFIDASDGLRAWEKLQTSRVNFIISDWNMPNMTGLDLLKKVRGSQKLKDIPFLMITAEVVDEIVAESIEYGVDGYITKPFQAETLLGKIDRILEKRANPAPIDIAIRSGKQALMDGNNQEAVESFKKAVEISPDSPRALLGLGEALEAAGENEQALEHYQKSVEKAKNYVTAHDRLAGLHQKMGNEEAATIHMKQAAKISPRNTSRQLELGKSLIKQGKSDEAMQAFGKARDVGAEDPKVATEVGEILLAANMNEEAAEAFQSAVETDPNAVHVYNRLGIAFRRQKRHDAAVVQYRKALQVAPDDENLHYNLAVALAEMGNFKEAKSSLKNAMRLKPNFSEAKELFTRLSGAK